MKLNSAILLPAALLAALLGTSAAQAQTVPPPVYPLTFVLTPGTEIGNPGDVLNFSGTLSNTSDNAVFLNGDSPTFNGPGTVDDSPFLNAPVTSLDPIGTVDGNGNPTDIYTGSFFDVDINPDAAPGTYTGTFEILGGADSNAQDIVGSADFSVTVLAPAAVPEASTTTSLGLLLALGLGSIVVARRRKTLCGLEA